MKSKKYLGSLITVYLCYFTHGMQAIILSQNAQYFYQKWGYTDAKAGMAAVSLAITATGFGKFLTVWLGGEISDKVGRKKMAIGGAFLYVLCFGALLVTDSMTVAAISAFLAGVATSGFWDAALYPAAQESAPKFAASAVLAIKLFVSTSGVIYPLLVVHFTASGKPELGVWVPLIASVLCLIMAIVSPFAYDDEIKTKVESGNNHETVNVAQLEIEEQKAKMLVKPSGLVNFVTMFYAFICMFIMYGAQQYTKAFGLNNAGLTEMQAAGLTSVYTFGAILAVIFWAFMMAKLRWNPLKVLLIDSIFTTVALVMVLVIHIPAVIFISIAMIGFFAAGGALQAGLSVRQEFCPGPKGRNTGIYYTWMGLAATFLPYMVSAMTKQVGDQRAIYIMMVLLLVAAVVSIVMMVYLVAMYKKIFGRNPLSNK